LLALIDAICYVLLFVHAERAISRTRGRVIGAVRDITFSWYRIRGSWRFLIICRMVLMQIFFSLILVVFILQGSGAVREVQIFTMICIGRSRTHEFRDIDAAGRGKVLMGGSFLHFGRSERDVFSGGAIVAVVRRWVMEILLRSFHGRRHGSRADQNKTKEITTERGTQVVNERNTRKLHRP
jgi:hypothetical protein